MDYFEKTSWNVRFNTHIVKAIGYEWRGALGVPVAEIRNGQYISVAVVAIEKGYIDLHNCNYGLRRINSEERKILESMGCVISSAEFVTMAK